MVPGEPGLWRERLVTTKNSGMKMVATKVAMIMPPNTPLPIDRRALAPAPLENTSATTPSTNASEVMMIGRKRSRAACSAASTGCMPSR